MPPHASDLRKENSPLSSTTPPNPSFLLKTYKSFRPKTARFGTWRGVPRSTTLSNFSLKKRN